MKKPKMNPKRPSMKKLVNRVKKFTITSSPKARETDIVDLIREDHKPLKRLIETLKNADATRQEKEPAYAEFAPRLHAHAKSEEQSLYVHMKYESALRSEAFEGDTEHQIADQLVNEIEMAEEDDDIWMAKVKVLAELVEHHIEEEEEEILKDVEQELSTEERMAIGEEYLRLRGDWETDRFAA